MYILNMLWFVLCCVRIRLFSLFYCLLNIVCSCSLLYVVLPSNIIIKNST